MFTFDGIMFTKNPSEHCHSCWSEHLVNIGGSKVNIVFCVFSCWSECVNIGGVYMQLFPAISHFLEVE